MYGHVRQIYGYGDRPVNQDTPLVYDVSSILNSDLDIQRVLVDVLNITVNRVGADNGSILIFDEQGTVAHEILARAGLPAEKAQAVIAEVLARGLAGWVIEQRRGCVVRDVQSDERWLSFPDDELQGGSAVSVPLVRRDRVVGVLTLRHAEPGYLTADHLALLSSLADQAVIAVENARLFYSVQAERAKMEAIFNGAGDAILVTDPQGTVTLMNAAARHAFGVWSELETQRPHLTDLVEDQGLDMLWEKRSEAAHPVVGEIALPDDRTFSAGLTSVPDVGFVLVMQDITHLKQLDQAKNEFLSAVSHDLRAPLQLVHAYASMLSDAGPLSPQQTEYVRGIHRSVHKMVTMVNDLIDLARIEAGVGMSHEMCHVDLIIEQVVARFFETAREKGLTLRFQVRPDLPPVQASPSRIDQVVSNLVDNALKYTFEGAVTVEASADDRDVIVRVADTGIGLMPQEQKGLFGKFYRAANKWTAKIDGTGLGLAIARSIIEQYHGRIWAQSTWQKGSCFSFSLPRAVQE
jgi:signal transduction histidine kinase